MKRKRSGLLLIISGPAGSGKGTVVRALIERHPEIGLSVSATTRQPRPGEIDGVHYRFITKDAFETMIEKGDVLEYTQYCGNYYGTPAVPVREALDRGQDMILEIEVDGGMQVRRKFRRAVNIMLVPPDARSLEARLRGRGTETEEVIEKRLARAKEELALMKRYDYVVVNEDGRSGDCADEIYAILTAEHAKTKRNRSFIEHFFGKNNKGEQV